MVSVFRIDFCRAAAEPQATERGDDLDRLPGIRPARERHASSGTGGREADRWRLAFIRRARALGFALEEIRDLLGPAEARSTGDIVRAAETRLKVVDRQLGELARLRCRLRHLVHVCEHSNGDDCLALRLGADETVPA